MLIMTMKLINRNNDISFKRTYVILIWNLLIYLTLDFIGRIKDSSKWIPDRRVRDSFQLKPQNN